MIFFQKKDEEDGISDELYHRHFHDGKRVWNNLGYAIDFDGNTDPDCYDTIRDKICAENNIPIKYSKKIFDKLPDKIKRIVIKYTMENYYDLFKKRRGDECKYCGDVVNEKDTDAVRYITQITSKIGIQAKTKLIAVKILELAMKDQHDIAEMIRKDNPEQPNYLMDGSPLGWAAAALYIACLKNSDELLDRIGFPINHNSSFEEMEQVRNVFAKAINSRFQLRHRASGKRWNGQGDTIDGYVDALANPDDIRMGQVGWEGEYRIKRSTSDLTNSYHRGYHPERMYGGTYLGDGISLDLVCDKRECQDRLSGEKLKEELERETREQEEREREQLERERMEREAREQEQLEREQLEREAREQEEREREQWEREARERMEREAREQEERERKEREWQKMFYWSNFRKTDYYVPQEWHGNKPSKDRTSDEEFDELVDEYLVTIRGDEVSNDEKKIHERMITTLFISEFTARREAQPDFTNMKDETRKREKAKKKEEEGIQEEAKKSARDQILTEEDLDGTPESILGVSKNASEKQVKAAYRERLKIYHPDKWKKGQKFAHKATVSIKESFDKIMKKFKGKKDSKKT